ncbi:hypothetical protein AB205_0099720 [Aquarana catesbeiana]|uniref:Immunoglobulin V-set domain-containing protein n=1 Tax=Aquarana catesbeiana TaxID=8400 RepID=A0A2G9RGU0_AQUCT|nr:hypothetical protein AB205_0099720 [Aquarana catesbeiana]
MSALSFNNVIPNFSFLLYFLFSQEGVKMEMSARFFLLFLLFSLGSIGQIRMAKTPNVISTSPRETVTITCTTHKAVNDTNPKFHALPRNYQKPEQSPPLIIYHAYRQNTGVSDEISHTVSIPDVILKIANFEIPDESDFYCQQRKERPNTQ